MSQSGYNKVEMVILLTIVLIIIMAFLGFVFDIQRSVRDTKRRGDIEVIAKQLELHFNRQADEFCNGLIDSYCAPQSGWFEKNKLPIDPLNQQDYLNLPFDGSKNFYICAKLEKGGEFCQGGQQ